MSPSFPHRISRFPSTIGILIAPLIAILVMLLSTAGPVQAATATTCANNGSIIMGKYWLNNNLWGQGSGSGWQCTWSNSVSGSTINWGTTWNWSGQQNSVKSYSSSILGWHWGWRLGGSGLPVQLAAGHNINTGWGFNLSGSSALDISYDTWLHTTSNPTANSTPSDEVMVWLYKSGPIGPIGSQVATVNLDGATWNLYEGYTSWQVHSFVRTSNTTSQSLNLKDFYNYLISYRGLSRFKYLSGIESGTEIFTGQGKLDTNYYYTNVN